MHQLFDHVMVATAVVFIVAVLTMAMAPAPVAIPLRRARPGDWAMIIALASVIVVLVEL